MSVRACVLLLAARGGGCVRGWCCALLPFFLSQEMHIPVYVNHRQQAMIPPKKGTKDLYLLYTYISYRYQYYWYTRTHLSLKRKRMQLLCTFLLAATVVALLGVLVYGSDHNKPHVHRGNLVPYDGKLIDFPLSAHQEQTLTDGKPIFSNERSGNSGSGIVIQDIKAIPSICMKKLLDFDNYHKMVPHVKKVDSYNRIAHKNGSTIVGAGFTVGMMGMQVKYYLKFHHRVLTAAAVAVRTKLLSNKQKQQEQEGQHSLTWTLDYDRLSDFDDNVGHWQVVKHPHKEGWSRVLFTTKMRLFARVPEFIIRYVTSKALLESTSWLKREAELEDVNRREMQVVLHLPGVNNNINNNNDTNAIYSLNSNSNDQGERYVGGLFSAAWRRLKGGSISPSLSATRCPSSSSSSSSSAGIPTSYTGQSGTNRDLSCSSFSSYSGGSYSCGSRIGSSLSKRSHTVSSRAPQ